MKQSLSSYLQLAVAGCLLVSLAPWLPAECNDNHDDDPFPAITKVIDKLEAYASGANQASGLTLADLEAAKREFESWPAAKRQEAKRVPMIRLVVDFALTPMSFAAHTLNLSEPDTLKAFVRRLELCFKRFQPAYEGERLSDTVAIRVAKTFELYNALSKRAPISMAMFRAAKRESEAWRSRMEELTNEEDIYAHLNELTNLFNYFNLFTLKPLWFDVFPKMEENPQLGVEQLVKLYHQGLERRFNVIINEQGNMVRYVDG